MHGKGFIKHHNLDYQIVHEMPHGRHHTSFAAPLSLICLIYLDALELQKQVVVLLPRDKLAVLRESLVVHNSSSKVRENSGDIVFDY
jgi:hypothetical protein